jgi:hypothetical protein
MAKGLKASDGYRWLRPFMFYELAFEFWRAAKDLEVKGVFSPVHYFLYCRSIELSLKAFLLAKKVPVSRLRDRKGVGHDLERALEEAELRGLCDIVEIPCEFREELRKANYFYVKKQGFEYADDYEVLMGFGNLQPSTEVLSEFASMLVTNLEKVCCECLYILGIKLKVGELYINGES